VRPLVLREPLSDGAVSLRHWRDDDVPAIVAACQDPEIPRWTSVPVPYADADARAFLASLPAAMQAGASCTFAIVERGADEPVGAIGFPRLSWEDERAEVGYWVAAPARGRGVAARAVRLLCRWGFAEAGFHRIELLAARENVASQRVAERAGFTREGVLRAHMLQKGLRRDMVIFSRLVGDPDLT
jgi:RimJ/RimL family protein N-acetyltransferase